MCAACLGWWGVSLTVDVLLRGELRMLRARKMLREREKKPDRFYQMYVEQRCAGARTATQADLTCEGGVRIARPAGRAHPTLPAILLRSSPKPRSPGPGSSTGISSAVRKWCPCMNSACPTESETKESPSGLQNVQDSVGHWWQKPLKTWSTQFWTILELGEAEDVQESVGHLFTNAAGRSYGFRGPMLP